MTSFISLATTASLLAMLPNAMTRFTAGSTSNIAVYWGQNSINRVGGQQRLSSYCDTTAISIIPLAFMNGITPAITNFANAGDNCTAFPDNANLLNCPQIDPSAAEAVAQSVWDMFGPVNNSVDRPFGNAVVDGFDFDFESTANNLPSFGAKLRSLMDGAGGKKYYLSAAPQCFFPDAAVGAVLNAAAFDFISIQFYNNWCGVSNFVEGSTTQNAYNFDVWNNWALSSKNPNVKLLVGVPAAAGSGGGYTDGSKLKAAINWSQKYSNFGGVMMWDMSQLWSNNGFLNEVVKDIAGGPSSTTTTTGMPSGTPTGGAGLPHWAQCGGQGYTGPTVCAAPYNCVSGGAWWSSCQ